MSITENNLWRGAFATMAVKEITSSIFAGRRRFVERAVSKVVEAHDEAHGKHSAGIIYKGKVYLHHERTTRADGPCHRAHLMMGRELIDMENLVTRLEQEERLVTQTLTKAMVSPDAVWLVPPRLWKYTSKGPDSYVLDDLKSRGLNDQDFEKNPQWAPILQIIDESLAYQFLN